MQHAELFSDTEVTFMGLVLLVFNSNLWTTEAQCC